MGSQKEKAGSWGLTDSMLKSSVFQSRLHSAMRAKPHLLSRMILKIKWRMFVQAGSWWKCREPWIGELFALDENTKLTNWDYRTKSNLAVQRPGGRVRKRKYLCMMPKASIGGDMRDIQNRASSINQALSQDQSGFWVSRRKRTNRKEWGWEERLG